jgi:hypothetical protein
VSAQPEVEAAKKSPLLRYGVGLVIELADSGRMPDGWNFETGSVMARLVAAGIVIEIKDWPT